MDSLDIFKKLGVLSDSEGVVTYLSTGVYALNYIISDKFNGGIPLERVVEFWGENSTAKSAFVNNILGEAQKAGYYTVLMDAENVYTKDFGKIMGIDPAKLIYRAKETLEDNFEEMETIVNAIREVDKETPIIIGFDSVAVCPSRSEFDKETVKEKYNSTNMDGAARAKALGSCLRKFNPLLKSKKVTLLIVNQVRNKVGVMYGSPDTKAAGGKSLDYYISVSLRTKSSKTKDVVLDASERPLGIKGTLENTKNKVGLPFRECDFELLFNKGFTKEFGLLEFFVKDGLITRAGAWYTIVSNNFKFQSSNFVDLLSTAKEFEEIRKLIYGN